MDRAVTRPRGLLLARHWAVFNPLRAVGAEGRPIVVEVVINFQAAPGRADELLPLLVEGRDMSKAADGCESFELFRRADDDHKFMFLERWSSIEQHHDNMINRIVASGHFGRILPLLVGPPDNGVIRLVS
jgi:quinol monooxygenase YgiN